MSGFNALLDPGQIGMGIQESFRQGREDMRAERARQAFSQYATDPNEQNAAAIAQHDPRIGMAMMDREAERQQQQMAQAKDQMGKFLKIAQFVESQPPEQREAAYQRGKQIGAQIGLSVDSAPATYAEAVQSGWLEKQISFGQIFSENPEVLSTAGKIAVDAGLQQGSPEFQNFVMEYTIASQAKPYTGAEGETRLYRPNFGQDGGPQPGHIEDGYIFKGGNPGDPGAWEQVGGPQASPAGGFPQ